MTYNTELMMENIGATYLGNSYISPIYVTATNMVFPLASISINYLHELMRVCYINVVEFSTIAANLLKIWGLTIYFIVYQCLVEISNMMTNVDKVLLAFIIYNIVMFAYKNYKLNSEVINLKLEVEQLEKNISYLKKVERMREDWDQTWAEEIRHYYTEHNNKYKDLNKEIKKIKKEMNKYN